MRDNIGTTQRIGSANMYVTNAVEEWRWQSFYSKEPETLKWIDSFSDDCIFYDVGCNVGIYSLYAQSLHPDARIFTFEPQASNFQRLRENMKLNGYNWQPIGPCGISNAIGWTLFKTDDETTGASGGSVSIIRVTAIPGGIPVYTIDSLTGWLSPCPTHIKIDIDHGEYAVIDGMKNTLLNPNLKSVLVEINDNHGWIASIFNKAGFTTDNEFNTMHPHSTDRRIREGIECRNVVFTR